MHIFTRKSSYLRSIKRTLMRFFITLLLSSSLFMTNPLCALAADYQINLVHHHRGNSASSGGCFGTPIYHTHSGSSSGGGCYSSPVYHSHSSSCKSTRTCTMGAVSVTQATSYAGHCSIHGAASFIQQTVTYRHQDCGMGNTQQTFSGCTSCGQSLYSNITTHTYDFYTCGKSTNTIEYYNLGCGKTAGVTVDRYDPSCGLEDNKSYGSLTVDPIPTEWTSGEITISAALSDPEGVLSQNGHGTISITTTDGTISSDNGSSVNVSDNGTYYVRLDIDSNLFDTADAEIMIPIHNIDKTPPTISSITKDESPFCKGNTVVVTASDLQPDGTPGSGIEAYSFDGGATWQPEAEYEYTQNDSYTICVKDKCGNISQDVVVIANIDNTPPSLTYTNTPHVWYENSGSGRTFVFTASDDEGGLDDEPYSYDDGATWTSDDTLLRNSAGTFSVWVRDVFGNIGKFTIQNDFTPLPAAQKEIELPIIPDIPGIPGWLPDDRKYPNYPVGIGTPEGDLDKDSDDGSNSSSGSSDNSDKSKNKPDNNRDTSGIKPGNPGNGSNDSGSSSRNSGNTSKQSSDNTSNTFDHHPDDRPQLTRSQNTPKEESKVVTQPEVSSQGPSEEETILNSKAPFYASTPFKVAAGTTGALLAIALLGLLFLLIYYGIRIYSFDGTKYRFIGLLPLSSSERGYSIKLSDSLIQRSYSSKYRLKMGPVFVKLHNNELIQIHAKESIIPVKVDRQIHFFLKDN